MTVIRRWEARPWTDTGAVFDVTSDVPEAALRIATCRTMGDAEMIARALNTQGAVGAIGDAIQLLAGYADGDAVDARALLRAAYRETNAPKET